MPIIRIPGSEPGGGAPRQLTNIAAAGAPGAGLGAIGQGIGALGQVIQGIQQENERRAEKKIRDQEREENKKYRDEMRELAAKDRERREKDRAIREQEKKEAEEEREKRAGERLVEIEERARLSQSWPARSSQIEAALAELPTATDEDKAAYAEQREELYETAFAEALAGIKSEDLQAQYRGLFDGIRESNYGTGEILADIEQEDTLQNTLKAMLPTGFAYDELLRNNTGTVASLVDGANTLWGVVTQYQKDYPDATASEMAQLNDGFNRMVGGLFSDMLNDPMKKFFISLEIMSGEGLRDAKFAGTKLREVKGKDLFDDALKDLAMREAGTMGTIDKDPDQLFMVQRGDSGEVLSIAPKESVTPEFKEMLESRLEDAPKGSEERALLQYALSQMPTKAAAAESYNTAAGYVLTGEGGEEVDTSSILGLENGVGSLLDKHLIKPMLEATNGGENFTPELAEKLKRYIDKFGPSRAVAELFAGKTAAWFVKNEELYNFARNGGLPPRTVQSSYVRAGNFPNVALPQQPEDMSWEEFKKAVLSAAAEEQGTAATEAKIGEAERGAELADSVLRGAREEVQRQLTAQTGQYVRIPSEVWQSVVARGKGKFPSARGNQLEAFVVGLTRDLAVDWGGTTKIPSIALEVYESVEGDLGRYQNEMERLYRSVAKMVAIDAPRRAAEGVAAAYEDRVANPEAYAAALAFQEYVATEQKVYDRDPAAYISEFDFTSPQRVKGGLGVTLIRTELSPLSETKKYVEGEPGSGFSASSRFYQTEPGQGGAGTSLFLFPDGLKDIDTEIASQAFAEAVFANPENSPQEMLGTLLLGTVGDFFRTLVPHYKEQFGARVATGYESLTSEEQERLSVAQKLNEQEGLWSWFQGGVAGRVRAIGERPFYRESTAMLYEGLEDLSTIRGSEFEPNPGFRFDMAGGIGTPRSQRMALYMFPRVAAFIEREVAKASSVPGSVGYAGRQIRQFGERAAVPGTEGLIGKISEATDTARIAAEAAAMSMAHEYASEATNDTEYVSRFLQFMMDEIGD